MAVVKEEGRVLSYAKTEASSCWGETFLYILQEALPK